MGAPVFLTGSLANLPATRDSDTLYFCTDGKLYKGNNLIAEKNNTISVVPMIVGEITGWNEDDNEATFAVIKKQGISNMMSIPAGTVFMLTNLNSTTCNVINYITDDDSGAEYYFWSSPTVTGDGGTLLAVSVAGGNGDLFVFSAT